jgi:hypothetical protein
MNPQEKSKSMRAILVEDVKANVVVAQQVEALYLPYEKGTERFALP